MSGTAGLMLTEVHAAAVVQDPDLDLEAAEQDGIDVGGVDRDHLGRLACAGGCALVLPVLDSCDPSGRG